MDLLPLNPGRPGLFRPQAGTTLLGLGFAEGRMAAVEVRRINGSVEIKHRLAAPLAVDLLTTAPELVGREIHKHLEAAGIRARQCVVCLPVHWVLTVACDVPALSGDDLASFLQLEAERGFPCSVDSLVVSHSRYRTPGGRDCATLVGVPRGHVQRLEEVLRAAQLRPVSFTLGLPALAGTEPGLALHPGKGAVALEVVCGGGVAALRQVQPAGEADDEESSVDHLAREIRIMLGQLPDDLRELTRRVRIYGTSANEAGLKVEELVAKLVTLGLVAEGITQVVPGEWPLKVPAEATPTPELSVTVRALAGKTPELEFLPPKVSRWQQLANRYSRGRLAWAGIAAGGLAIMVALAFGVQQAQLAYWRGKWDGMKTRVNELDDIQQRIRQFRPWYDPSCRSLSVLRCLTEAFPEDGGVSAKTVELREKAGVVCTGTARDSQALLRTLDKLRAAKEISGLQLEQMRGRSPLQYSFRFQWNERGNP